MLRLWKVKETTARRCFRICWGGMYKKTPNNWIIFIQNPRFDLHHLIQELHSSSIHFHSFAVTDPSKWEGKKKVADQKELGPLQIHWLCWKASLKKEEKVTVRDFTPTEGKLFCLWKCKDKQKDDKNMYKRKKKVVKMQQQKQAVHVQGLFAIMGPSPRRVKRGSSR